MATTFKALRQYEKIGLIVLGVVVMVVFTMGDFFNYSGRSGNDPTSAAKGAKLVTWNGGSLTKGQIEQIVDDHRHVIDIEQEIIQQISLDKKNPGQPKVQPIMAAAGDELVNRYIFSTYAADLGLQVDDEAVRTFLKKLSGDRMSMSEIKKVLDDVIGDTPEARTRLFNWMRRELASKAVERMIFSSQAGVAPDGAWEQFKMMMQRAQIEFIALPTEKYVDKVTDKPGQAELKTLYDELKRNYRRFDRPDIGLIRPEEIAFGWVKAEINAYLQEEKKKITDKQVEEYYEKNKTNYKKETKPPVQPPKSDEDKKPEGAETTESTETKPESDKPEAEEGKTPPADPNATKPESTDPAESKKDPKNEPEKPAEQPSGEPAKSADPASDPKSEEPAQTPKDSDGEDVSLISIISQDAPAKEQEPAKPAGDPPAAPQQKTDPNAGQEPAKEAQSGQKSADAPAGQDKPAEEKPVQDAKVEPEDEFKPLSEVAELIRSDLAAKPAEDRYNQALKDAETELRALWKKVNLGEGKIDQDALKKFDLEAFAAKYLFTSGRIPLSPPDKVQKEFEIGKFQGFLQEAYFSDKPMLYEPRVIKGNQFLSNEAYIYWRTEHKDEVEPKFEECEEDLRKAFRYRKAKEFAREDAKSKAAEVKGGKTLKEVFPKENVLVTGEFSYKTPFSRSVGEIPEIPGAGEAFLSEVFKMQTGQTKEIPLADQSEFYVVQLTKFAFSEKELRDQFANFPIVAELAQAADQQANETRIAAYREFLDRLEVKYPGQTELPPEE